MTGDVRERFKPIAPRDSEFHGISAELYSQLSEIPQSLDFYNHLNEVLL